ncbi:HNH endonuclease signature motif containing protein [Methylobacterium durans]|uniref:HNH endonuclease n=1 Tax=Methylobacterium durans TaxID=2202825 RepID=UPI002B0033FF|nr:HNH endonuclease signature motif containing protein [Methylobacterium durans]MEA1835056.1 HNH endonuclease signature motif containing protein [Methylobacterium durans]
MPLITPEDIGTTPRSCLSPRRRLQAWERTNGKCVVCGDRIDGARERWIVEHIRALELGGADELDNMGPAHEACGREKTRDDHSRTARAKRQKLRHIGAAAPERPLPGSRTSPLKRKINGTVVSRETRPQKPTAASYRSTKNCPKTAHNVGEGGIRRLAERFAIRSAGGDSSRPGSSEPSVTLPSTPSSSPSSTEAAHPVSQELLPTLPAHLTFLFEDRPLLLGEDVSLYDAVLASVVQQVKPRDVIETLWVKDLVDLIWEAKRLRLWRQRILAQARLQAAEALLKPVLEAQDKSAFPVISEIERTARDLALGWLNGRAPEAATVETLLQGRGLTTNDVTAKAFELKLPDLERIERMVMNADNRRDALLREIERKRVNLGRNLRVASEDIIDVEPALSGVQPAAHLSN